MDMESETVEQQTTDTIKLTNMDEKNYDGTIDPRLLQNDFSTHLRMTSPPVSTEQGEYLKEAQKSVRAERKESDEMEVCSDGDDTVVDKDEDFGAEIARVSDMDVNNTRFSGGHFSGGHYVMNNITDNTEGLDLDDIALPQCHHTEDILVSVENDALNTQETSVTHFATSRQTIVVSPEPDIDRTNEEVFEDTPPDSNSTSSGTNNTSSGTETSKESGEMSDTTEKPTYSVASFNQNNVEIKPFNFLGYPDKVRQTILRHILYNKKPIRPFYSFGALELPAQLATRENYTGVVTAFAGNPELVDQSTTILYGENEFHLDDAKIAVWWLKRIGSTNISKLRHLRLSLDEGAADHFGTRTETLWRQAFSLLHEHQQLHALTVCFRGWNMNKTTEDGLSSEDRRVWGPRYAVMRMLLQWRGLKKAEVKGGSFVTDYYAEVMVSALTMQPGETSDEIRKFEDEVGAPTGTRYSFA